MRIKPGMNPTALLFFGLAKSSMNPPGAELLLQGVCYEALSWPEMTDVPTQGLPQSAWCRLFLLSTTLYIQNKI